MFEGRVVIAHGIASFVHSVREFRPFQRRCLIAVVLTMCGITTIYSESQRAVFAQPPAPATTNSPAINPPVPPDGNAASQPSPPRVAPDVAGATNVQKQDYANDRPEGLMQFKVGRIAPGESISKEITIRNTGSKTWTIDRVDIDSEFLTAEPSARSVPAGGSIQFVLKFKAGDDYKAEVATAKCIFGGDVPGSITVEAGATIRPHVLLDRERIILHREFETSSLDFQVYQYDTEAWETFRLAIPESDFLEYSLRPAKKLTPHQEHPSLLPTRVWNLKLRMKLKKEPYGKQPRERPLTALIFPTVGGKELAPREVKFQLYAITGYDLYGTPVRLGTVTPQAEVSFNIRLLLDADELRNNDSLEAKLVGSNPGIEITESAIDRDKPYSIWFKGKVKVTLPQDKPLEFKRTRIGMQNADWHLLIKMSNGDEVFCPLAWFE